MESVRSDDDEFIDELELSAIVRESDVRLLKTISNEQDSVFLFWFINKNFEVALR